MEAVHHRHRNVHQDDVRPKALGQLNRVLSMLRDADELDPRLARKHRLQRLREQFVVVGDQDADWKFGPRYPRKGGGTQLYHPRAITLARLLRIRLEEKVTDVEHAVADR